MRKFDVSPQRTVVGNREADKRCGVGYQSCPRGSATNDCSNRSKRKKDRTGIFMLATPIEPILALDNTRSRAYDRLRYFTVSPATRLRNRSNTFSRYS